MATASATAEPEALDYRPVGVGLLAASAAVVALAYGPSLVEFFINQWQKPHYQHFPFILAAFAWLLWTRLGEATPREDRSAFESRPAKAFALALLSGAWLLLAVGVAARSPWLAAISAALWIAWGFVRIARSWQVTYLWAIWLVFLLVIPPPLNRDQELITYLQRMSSRASSFVLDWLGVLHLMEGNALMLLDKKFFVDEACSGIISVMSIIACALIYGVWQNRSPFHLATLIFAGVCWATVMNVFRIVSVAVAYSWYGLDWSSGAPHETLSLVVFTLTFLGLVSTDLALVAALAPVKEELQTHSAAEPVYGGWLIRAWDAVQNWQAPEPRAKDDDEPTADPRERLATLGAAYAMGPVGVGAFALIALLQGYLLAMGQTQVAHRDLAHLPEALALQQSDMPPALGPLRQVDFQKQEREIDSDFGAYSRVYTYEDAQGRRYIVSCDFPFGPGWHDLRVCYKGIGWELVDSTTEKPAADTKNLSPAATLDPDWEFSTADFQKGELSAGYFAYACFTDEGRRVSPPIGSIARESWTSLIKRQMAESQDRMFQIQVWTTAPKKIGAQQRTTATELLLAAREMMKQRIVFEKPAAPASAPAPAPAAAEAKTQAAATP